MELNDFKVADEQECKASNLIDKNRVYEATRALYGCLFNKPMLIKSDDSNCEAKPLDLLASNDEPIQLILSLKNVPSGISRRLRLHSLPHSWYHSDGEHTVCLFVADMKWRGTGRPRDDDNDRTAEHWRGLLQNAGITDVTAIVPFAVLRSEYTQYEARRRLAALHDVFLADHRLRTLLPRALGRHFYGRTNKTPLDCVLTRLQTPALDSASWELGSRSSHGRRRHVRPSRSTPKPTIAFKSGAALKNAVEGALSCAFIALNSHSPSFTSTPVAFSHMSESDVAENLLAAVQKIIVQVPGGIDNIRSIFVKARTTPAIPIYYSSTPTSSSTLERLASLRKRGKQLLCADESMDTLSASTRVNVWSDGRVNIVKTKKEENPEGADSDSESENESESESSGRRSKGKQRAKKRRNRVPSSKSRKTLSGAHAISGRSRSKRRALSAEESTKGYIELL